METKLSDIDFHSPERLDLNLKLLDDTLPWLEDLRDA
jgi:hypothetical protein